MCVSVMVGTTCGMWRCFALQMVLVFVLRFWILLFKVLVFLFVGFREFPLCFPALVDSGSRFDAVCLYDALVLVCLGLL